jgi:nitrite reductase/ring-hydroxylating ferredoxin subunit/uncharacterized membrane protein
MNPLLALVDAIERFDRLDGVASTVSKAVGWAVQPQFVRNLLSGTPIGHPLHPIMTDLPIGAWSMSTVLDTIGGKASEPAADLLVAVGIATAIPTAASGLNDWSDTTGKARRVGTVHAVANSTALCLFTSSAVARATGSRSVGKALGLAGFGILMFGGFLGGHLSYSNAVNINKTAGRVGPKEWTPVLAESELADGEHRKVSAGKVTVLVHRTGSSILALDSVCSHMGGPLEEGKIDGGCVICPWHGSTFRLEDGGIVRGPASNRQPSYEARVNDGQIEVRRRRAAS